MVEEKKEELVGKITHYFGKIEVGIVEITKGSLTVGDTIHIKGSATDFEQSVDSMQIEHQQVEKVKKGDVIGLKVKEKVKEGDEVYKIVE
ncbi:MAG: hypothetical protein ACOZAL_01310 [Patescibacteria group bacterium]